MIPRRQFTLRFMFVEVSLFAVALGLIRQGFLWGGGKGELCVIAALFVIGAALGGLFGSMLTGIWLTVLGIAVGSLFMS